MIKTCLVLLLLLALSNTILHAAEKPNFVVIFIDDMWPGRIPAGVVCDELAAMIVILPTIAALARAQLPDHKIDGQDIRPLMFGEKDAKSPHEVFLHYYPGELTDVAEQHPEIVARLQEAAKKARADLGDRLTRATGDGIRSHSD